MTGSSYSQMKLDYSNQLPQTLTVSLRGEANVKT